MTDPAGYRSPTETFTFNILPPSPPPPPPPPTPPRVTVALANDTGIPSFGSATADSTSNATLEGTADPGATVVLTLNGASLGDAVADSHGGWTFSPTGLSQGGQGVTATETNSSGLSDTYDFSFSYDTIAPAQPNAPQLALGGNIADTTTPVFTGSTEPNAEIFLLDGNTIVGTGTASGSGTWDVQTQALSVGYHNIGVEAIDAAGNSSPVSTTTTVEVVSSPPDQATLNDAAMIADGNINVVGTVSGGMTIH